MSSARPLSLFLVLFTARLFTLVFADLPVSVWTPLAYLWQDALTVLTFGVLQALVRREWFAWTLYSVAVVYVAVNVGVLRVLYSPLTWTMLRAARGPLADSARHHLSAANVAAVVATIGIGFLLPTLLLRAKFKVGVPLILTCVALAAAGPYAITQVDTGGGYRNAFGALWPLRLPRAPANAGVEDWRMSPFGSVPADDLASLRGRAAGRNVVIVSLESTGARYLKPFGAAVDPMPNLSDMASHAIVFENAYSVYPESIKGLFSVLCSRYPAFNVDAQIYARIDCPSLPKELRAAGYRTALFHSGRFMYLGMESIVKNRGFDTLEDAGAIGGNVHSSFGVGEPAAVERILAWIDSLEPGQKFFVTYLPIAGHHPYATPTPGPFSDDGGEGSYRNALYYGDESLGVLFRGLRERGLDRNTLFVIFGDHGEAFGQHEGNFGHTLFIYDENVHVPYLIAAPGLIDEPVRVQRSASLIDTAPTILDLVGASIPAQYQGGSLLDPHQRLALFFTDYSLGWLGLVDSCWKYLYETDSGRSKLYEICRDPAESRDLSGVYGDRVEVYRTKLKHWIAAQEIPGR